MNFLLMARAFCSAHAYLWCGAALQRRITERRLRRTVQRAYRDVPWYRESFDRHGIDPARFRGTDLVRLPLLEKQQLRDNFPDRIVARGSDLAQAVTSTTSGSSGRMLQVAYPQETYAYYLALALRVYTMIGYRPWHRITYIKYEAIKRPAWSLGPFFRVEHLSSFLPVAELVAALREQRPHLLVGYANVVLELARHLERHPEPQIAPRFVSLNSEQSTAQERQYIAGVLGCPVYDEYSSEETWMIASHCRAGRYHVFTDNVVLELVDNSGAPVPAGEVGEVLVTTLNNPLMPLIRYRLGDLARARPGRCECGNPQPMLESFEGRKDDALRMPDGRRILPFVPILTMTNLDRVHPEAIASYKFLQTDLHRVELQLVPGPAFGAAVLQDLLAELQPLLDSSVKIVPRLMTAIDPGRIKRRAVECRVSD